MKDIPFFFDPSVFPLSEEQQSILKKLIVGLSSMQKIWVSGYLYASVVNSDLKIQSFNDNAKINDRRGSTIVSIPNNITVLSASQTGNARKLAEELYQFLVAEKFSARLINVSNYNFKKLSQERLFFLITSTYGEGEPPEEAVMLYRYLFSRNAPNLKGVNFSVFGLGDSTYENFSKAAKDFDSRLEELGACRIYPRVDADLDYEQQAIHWRESIITLLKSKFMIFNFNYTVNSMSYTRINSKTTKTFKIGSNKYTKNMPFNASLLVRQKITSRDAFKDVYHLEIDLSGSGICYQPGDALGVWYENDPNLVIELLGYCKLIGNEKININEKCFPISVVLQKYYELTHNTPVVVKKYAALIDNHDLLSLSFNDIELKKFTASNSIVDMVRCWSPLKLLPEQLLSILRPLQPRLYSISSAQQEVGEEVHITVSAVRYIVDNHVRSGGASGYLVDRLLEGDKLRIFVVSNESFRLPNYFDASIIMIAAGTGIAPFRSFMQQRFSDRASGKNWLFFGNLSFANDFLYQKEWQEYVRDGLLTRINTAWSRDQENKIYIQDKIAKNGSEIWKWIQDGAYIYVCGDASRMAYCVERSLIQLFIEYGKMNIEESDIFLNNMRMVHRYQRDIY